MAQVSDGKSWANAKIWMSTDGATWVDLSGESNKLSASGFERATGQQTTNEGDLPIITFGKLAPGNITLTAVYRKAANSAWKLAQAAYANSSAVYIRWSPEGGNSGDERFTSKAGRVLKPVWPVGDSGDAKVLLVDIDIFTSGVDEDVVP